MTLFATVMYCVGIGSTGGSILFFLMGDALAGYKMLMAGLLLQIWAKVHMEEPKKPMKQSTLMEDNL